MFPKIRKFRLIAYEQRACVPAGNRGMAEGALSPSPAVSGTRRSRRGGWNRKPRGCEPPRSAVVPQTAITPSRSSWWFWQLLSFFLLLRMLLYETERKREGETGEERERKREKETEEERESRGSLPRRAALRFGSRTASSGFDVSRLAVSAIKRVRTAHIRRVPHAPVCARVYARINAVRLRIRFRLNGVADWGAQNKWMKLTSDRCKWDRCWLSMLRESRRPRTVRSGEEEEAELARWTATALADIKHRFHSAHKSKQTRADLSNKLIHGSMPGSMIDDSFNSFIPEDIARNISRSCTRVC